MSDIKMRPDVRTFLDFLKAHPRPQMTAEALPMMRQMAPQGMAMLEPPVGELARMVDHVVPGPGGDIPIRLFDARAERPAGPVVVFFHGGGFVIGNIDTHASMCAEIARSLDLPVVSVDYRLAPENPWPAAPDDAEAATRWVVDHGPTLGLEIDSLVLCGDSAGANLTIVTALALRARPARVPVIVQLPIYPAVDMFGSYESRDLFGAGFGLDSVDIALYNRSYAPARDDWRGTPLIADLAGLPPMLLVTAGLDPLRDQGRAFAAKAVQAGVTTTYWEVEGTIHGFAGFRRAIPSGVADVAAILAQAKAMIGLYRPVG